MYAARASIQIQQPIPLVFAAMTEEKHLCVYFLSECSGDLKEGTTVHWKFPEFPDVFPVSQIGLTPYESITFKWDPETKVEITLQSLSDSSTLVRVAESGWPSTAAAAEPALRNTEGWANFLACLKAYLEYGINLRKGAFDFMKTGD
jgi:uncharacterized protein YndB with AHSA1/START domain